MELLQKMKLGRHDSSIREYVVNEEAVGHPQFHIPGSGWNVAGAALRIRVFSPQKNWKYECGSHHTTVLNGKPWGQIEEMLPLVYIIPQRPYFKVVYRIRDEGLRV